MTDTTHNTDINETLKSNYLLVSLSISRWNASRPDAVLAAETAAAHGASPEAVRVTKKLMAGADSELKAVEKTLNAIRSYVYSVSLPWASNDDGAKRGPRLIPTATSIDFLRHVSALDKEFRTALNDFKAVYASRVQEALVKQGTMADMSQYPDASDLDDMFGTRMDLEPVPTVSDFTRMSLPANLATALGSRMGNRQAKVVENAMSDLTNRIAGAVGNMASQLAKHAAGEKTRLYASLVDNVKTLLGLLRASNLTNDPRLTELADMMDSIVLHDIKTLKDNPGTAKAVADKAKDIVKRLAVPKPEPSTGLDTQPERAITKPEPTPEPELNPDSKAAAVFGYEPEPELVLAPIIEEESTEDDSDGLWY